MIDTQPPASATLRSPANAATTSDTTPTFLWRYQSEGAGYELQVATDGGFGAPIIDKTLGRLTSYTPAWNAALPRGVTYYWRVRTRDAAGNWSDWSAPWTLTIQ